MNLSSIRGYQTMGLSSHPTRRKVLLYPGEDGYFVVDPYYQAIDHEPNAVKLKPDHSGALN